MRGLPQKQNARRAYKIRLCGHLRRYKKIVKKTYIILWKNKHIYSICIHLGELALPIYCIHYPIQDWIQRLFPLNGYWLKLGMSIVWSVMISELMLLVCKKWGEQKRIVQKETTL